MQLEKCAIRHSQITEVAHEGHHIRLLHGTIHRCLLLHSALATSLFFSKKLPHSLKMSAGFALDASGMVRVLTFLITFNADIYLVKNKIRYFVLLLASPTPQGPSGTHVDITYKPACQPACLPSILPSYFTNLFIHLVVI